MSSINTVRDGTGDPWHMLGDALGRVRIYDDWTPSLQSDEAANDSDKTFTVPADTQWRVKWIWVEYTSDGNAGNRELIVEIQDNAADVIARIKVGIVQAASLTRYYMLSPNVVELTAFRGTAAADYLSTIMPEWVLPEAYVVRVWDSVAVSAAGDDVIIQMGIESRPMP
jgi:hypothetical protein